MPKRDASYMKKKRLKILGAARRVALRKGLAHVTLREIAKEARLSMGALATHFARREDLVAFAAHQASRERAAAASELTSARSLACRLSSPEFAEEMALDLELVTEARCSRDLHAIVRSSVEDATEQVGASWREAGFSSRAVSDRARLVVALHYGLGVLALLGLSPSRRSVESVLQTLIEADRA